ncbi:MAG: glycogen synthase [Candidatus Aenigmatarchaeota archaeon]|jgi:starch synthase
MQDLKDKTILIVSPELKTFKSRAGGLGQVVEELAKALAEEGLKIYVASCLYKYVTIDAYKKENDFSDLNLKEVGEIEIEIDKKYKTKIFTTQKYGATFIFLFNDELTESLYIGDLLKFSVFFAKGTLEALKLLKIKPDIIHLNDALTSLIPIYTKDDPSYKEFVDTKFVFTIHNAGLGYQQIHPIERKNILNLHSFSLEKLIWNGNINLLYTGVENSEIVNTVSEDYAINLKVEGEGMREVFVRKNVFGILNGIDVEYWRSKAYKNATIENILEIKNIEKEKLIREIKARTGKKLDKNEMIVIMPRRLSGQKGFDTIMPIIEEVYNKYKIQFIVLGVAHPNDSIGQEWARKFFELHKRLEGFAFIYAFDEDLAKLMYSGADLLLYPSLPNKEPCGTGYMMSMVNATPCLGTKTGGLAEVIKEFDEVLENGNGFLVWKEEYSTKAFLEKLEKAYRIFKNKEKWRKLAWNAFKTEVDIKNAAKEYVAKVYLQALKI